MVVLADDGEFGGVVQHVDEALGGQEALADQQRLGRVPERVLVLGEFGDHAGLVVLLDHVFYYEVPVGEFGQVP